MEAMKPCPFCGGEPHLERNHRNFVKGEPTRVSLVRCTQCEAKSGKFDLRAYEPKIANALAIEAWNRRADEPPRWISVKDRLPEKKGEYLCWLNFIDRPIAMTVRYLGNGCWGLTSSTISHWMENVDPPKMEDK